MDVWLLHPYPQPLPSTRLKWSASRRRRHLLRCVAAAATAATLERELVVSPDPRTARNPGRSNPGSLFDGMPERSTTSSTATAGGLFDEMPQTSEAAAASGGGCGKSASAGIVALAHARRHAEVVALFCRMRRGGVPVSKFVLPSVLRACAALQDGRTLRVAHAFITKCALYQHVVVGTTLVDAYIGLGLIDDARKAFDEINEANMVSWSVIISVYARSSRWDEAWDAFSAMQRAGMVLNVSVLVMAIQACGALGCLVRGRQLHKLALVLGFERNPSVWNCLIDMYGKCGDIGSCRMVFETMIGRDQASWNTIISSYIRLSRYEEALDMIVQMQESGFTVDRFTLGSGVAACAHLADIRRDRAFHCYLMRRALDVNVIQGSALVDMYGKCGLMKLALLLFDRMDERNYVSWNALLSGYVENGQAESALAIFQ